MPNRFGVLFCAIVMTALVVLGLWQAFAGEAPQTHTIMIHAMKYDPAVVHVRRGDQVVFKNDDFLPHTATAKTTGGFDSGMIKPGESWTMAQPASADVHFRCMYHPTMEGEIVVDQ